MQEFRFLSISLPVLLLTLMINVSAYYEEMGIKADSAYNEVVLEISSVRITRYEYEKLLNEFINKYSQENHKNPSEETLGLWKKDFVDRMYLLADLKNRGFGEREDVLNTVNSMAGIILTQDHGLVYDHFVTSKVNVSEEEVKAAYDKSGKHIKVEYLIFPDDEAFNSLARIVDESMAIKDEKEFKGLSFVCKDYPQIKKIETELIWPYVGFDNSLADRIYGLRKGEIALVKEAGAVHLFHVQDILYKEKTAYKDISPKIQRILKENELIELSKEYNDKIDGKVRASVSEDVCDKFMKKYSIDYFKDFIDSSRNKKLNSQFKEMLADTILTYSIDTTEYTFTVNSFLSHYSTSLMLPIFQNNSDVQNYLSEYAREEYIMQLADSLGLADDIKFKLDKKNYKNKTILSFYEQRELIPGIVITEADIEKYYKDNLFNYSGSDTAKISIYTFDNYNNAYIGMVNLRRGIPLETEGKYTGLKKVQRDIYTTRDDRRYSEDIYKIVFDLENGQYSEPIESRSNYLVINRIAGAGSVFRPLREVKTAVKQSLIESKCDMIKGKIISKAKKKYSVGINKVALP